MRIKYFTFLLLKVHNIAIRYWFIIIFACFWLSEYICNEKSLNKDGWPGLISLRSLQTSKKLGQCITIWLVLRRCKKSVNSILYLQSKNEKLWFCVYVYVCQMMEVNFICYRIDFRHKWLKKCVWPMCVCGVCGECQSTICFTTPSVYLIKVLFGEYVIIWLSCWQRWCVTHTVLHCGRFT
jgi:hypothetical protein